SLGAGCAERELFLLDLLQLFSKGVKVLEHLVVLFARDRPLFLRPSSRMWQGHQQGREKNGQDGAATPMASTPRVHASSLWTFRFKQLFRGGGPGGKLAGPAKGVAGWRWKAPV